MSYLLNYVIVIYGVIIIVSYYGQLSADIEIKNNKISKPRLTKIVLIL